MTNREVTGGGTFSVRADRRLVRARGRSVRHVRVEIQAPEAAPRRERHPVSLAFVLDRSGSMGGQKIEMVRRAVIHGIRSLSGQDRFSVVVFDDQVEVIVPSTLATPDTRRAAERAVKAIAVRGCTDLCGGWLHGCQQVGLELGEETVGRCLLLTDGIANEGITDHGEILKHVRALRNRRVATSTFGVGQDFDETLLRPMAETGGGNFHFIEQARQIPDFLAQEVGETLKMTARDVALVIEAGSGVAVESLNGFACRRVESGVWRVEIGSLFSGRVIDPVVRLTFPVGSVGERRPVAVRVEDRDGVFESVVGRLTFQWVDDGTVDAQERDRVVDRRVVQLAAARAYQGALERNRAGDYAGARELLETTAQTIHGFAGDDPEALSTLGTMRVQVDEVSLPMGSLARKRGYSDSYGTLTGRGVRVVPSMPHPTASPMPNPTRNVVLMATGDIRSVVDAAVPELAAADPELFGDMVLDSRLSRVLEAVPAAPLELDGLSQLAVAASKCVPEARVRVVFVPGPLAQGRTSHWDTDHQTAIASLAELDGPLAAAPQAFVASEIVFHALHLLGPGYQPDRLGHGESRSCLYDWVRTSASVENMIDGDGLCPDCLRRLKARRISPDRLLRLHAAIKELTAGSPVVH